MTPTSRTHLWRLSILSQFGLMSACGGAVTAEKNPAQDEPPVDPGARVSVTSENGSETGLSRFENEAVEFRTGAPVCSNLPEDSASVLSNPGLEGECATGADCTAKEHGYCTTTEGQILESMCAYGCTTDADCTDQEACDCGPAVGSCVPAECRADDDCGEGRCLRVVEQDRCVDGFGPTTSYQCERDVDTCTTDADCEEEEACLNEGAAGRQCVERQLCGIGRPFLVDNEARLAAATVRVDWEWSDLDLAGWGRGLSAAQRQELAEGWRQIALMEHASIAAFARFQLQLLALGAPASLVEATNRALVDETRHARLAFALTGALEGRNVGPGPLAVDRALEQIDLEQIALLVLLEGCIGETCAAMEASWAAERCEDAALGALLMNVAEDERRHSELAWQFVTWATEDNPQLAARLLERALLKAREPALGASTKEDAWISAYGLTPESARLTLRTLAFDEIVIPCLIALSEHRRAA